MRPRMASILSTMCAFFTAYLPAKCIAPAAEGNDAVAKVSFAGMGRHRQRVQLHRLGDDSIRPVGVRAPVAEGVVLAVVDDLRRQRSNVLLAGHSPRPPLRHKVRSRPAQHVRLSGGAASWRGQQLGCVGLKPAAGLQVVQTDTDRRHRWVPAAAGEKLAARAIAASLAAVNLPARLRRSAGDNGADGGQAAQHLATSLGGHREGPQAPRMGQGGKAGRALRAPIEHNTREPIGQQSADSLSTRHRERDGNARRLESLGLCRRKATLQLPATGRRVQAARTTGRRCQRVRDAQSSAAAAAPLLLSAPPCRRGANRLEHLRRRRSGSEHDRRSCSDRVRVGHGYTPVFAPAGSALGSYHVRLPMLTAAGQTAVVPQGLHVAFTCHATTTLHVCARHPPDVDAWTHLH
eukprot:scaffold359_cov313-Prasinococcus_capsulatus_cf.AAC.6